MIGLPILGLVDNINKINRDMIIDFHQNNYYGENLIISAAGGAEHDLVCEIVEK